MPKKIYRLLSIIIFSIFVISCSSTNKNSKQSSSDYKSILSESEIRLDSIDKDRMIVDLIVEAKKHEDKNDFAKALIEYQYALEFDTTASLLFMEGNAYYELGMYSKAKRSFKKSLLMEPDFEDALRNLIKIYIIEKDVARASVLIAELEKISNTRVSLETVAEFYSHVKPKKAIEVYEDLYNKYKDNIYEKELLRLYSLTKEKDKYYEFIEKNVFNSENYNISLYKNLTLHYIKDNKHEDFNKLINHINRKFSKADIDDYYLSLSNYIYSNFYDVSDKIKSIFIDNIDNRFIFKQRIAFNAGVISFETDKKLKAEQYFDWALKSNENNDENVPFSIGYFYFDKEEYQKAIDVFKSYRRDSTTFWETDYYLAHSYLAMDNTDSTLKYLRSASRIDSTAFFIFTDLGLVYDQIGEPDSAIYYYDRSLKLEPENITTLNNFAYTLSVQEIRLEEALEMIEKVMLKEPENPTFIDTYAWVKFKMGDYETAKSELLRALEKTQENAEIYLHLAEVYKKLGILEKAKESADKAFELAPDNKDIKRLIDELKTK